MSVLPLIFAAAINASPGSVQGTDGVRLVRVNEVPLTKKRSNKSLESLTITPDGRTLWTANEQALICDGDSSCGNATVKTVVRLMKYTRASATAGWMTARTASLVCALKLTGVGAASPAAKR